MSTRMLIDARHPEETRVAVVKGNRVEEFDYESVTKRQLKGNIYLAKVMRVEPSLQAAFVDYGGNRHGFLAFSEIHPDYYQIPTEDREALLAAEAEEAKAEAEAEPEEKSGNGRRRGRRKSAKASNGGESGNNGGESGNNDGNGNGDEVEQVSGDDDIEDLRSRRPSTALKRRYKIQEVIKRKQILLVQVVKEERGNKGAALTTYLSLAGRYCVLMPNSPRGGGISRKIGNVADRKKLKSVMTALQVPEGMGCIIRTAGLNRTKTEIKRDFDYLLRLWDEIRELTLKSVAPALIYEEANLIKRSIRDLYTRDIDEVLVEGEDGYRIAKDFMKLLMPSHAKRVKNYKERIPLLHRYQVEQQLEAMYSPLVQLKSGGYIVINPTEALVSIDVNSGRSTKEHNVEETAVKTNLEAADEVARQLRLRDMAGLIVIDFIDMDERRNNRNVEKRVKDALKNDRARIQVGRISHFGLMEMSRQRLRPNLLEASMQVCPSCAGAGVVRSTESGALAILRALEEEGIRGRSAEVTIKAPAEVAIYLLNQKRSMLSDMEREYGLRINVLADEDLGAAPFALERLPRNADTPSDTEVIVPEGAVAEAATQPAKEAKAVSERAGEAPRASDPPYRPEAAAAGEEDEDEGKPRRKRRRRRRGGRGRRGGGEESREAARSAEESGEGEGEGEGHGEEPARTAAEAAGPQEVAEAAPKRRRRERPAEEEPAAEAETAGDKPRRRVRRRRKAQAEGAGAQDRRDRTPDETAAFETEGRADSQPEDESGPEAVPEGLAAGAPSPAEAKARRAQAQTEGEAKPRRRRRKAETPSGETGEDRGQAEGEKPRRRRRKTAAETEPAPAPSETPGEAPEAAPKAARTRQKKADAVQGGPAGAPPAAETPVEREVVTPAGAEEGGSDKPKKRKGGWWQRAFGG